jgi:hypothetical protein
MSRMSRIEMLRWDIACGMYKVHNKLPYKVKNGRVDYGWLNKPSELYILLIDKICPGGMPDSW